MPEITKPMHMVYLGEKAKGKLQEVRAYIGIKIGTPGTFELDRDKNYIKVEQIEESDIDINEFELIFSIDNRDIEIFKKLINDNRSILDRFDLSHHENFQKLLEKMKEKGYRRENEIIIEKISDSKTFTVKDIGKVIVVDQSAPNIAQNIKHKIIEVIFIDGQFRREWKHNREFSANAGDNLLFYVEESSVDFFCGFIDKCMNAHLRDSAEPTAVLANLGNEIITNLKKLVDKGTGLPLSLTIYPDVKSAQHAYVEVAGTIGLSPETLIEKIATKAKTLDSESVKSEDSGVSSQAETSQDVSGKPAKNLYPELNDSTETKAVDLGSSNLEKQTISSSLEELERFISSNRTIFQARIGALQLAINKIRSVIQDGTNLDSSDEVKQKISIIADIVKRELKAETETLGFHENYKSAIKDSMDVSLKVTDDEGKFKGIVQLVDTITNKIPKLIKECQQTNAQFISKCKEYNEHFGYINSLFSALVVDINFEDKKEELNSVIDSWRKNLEEFIPIIDGHAQSQKTLSAEIVKLKGIFNEKYCALQSVNHAILKERLEENVNELRVYAERLQAEEGSAIAERQGWLLSEIDTLLSIIPQAMPANEKIKEFQAQYDNLKGNVAALEQELTFKQDLLNFYDDKLSKTILEIHAKTLKLEKEGKKGDEAAGNKAGKLSEIRDKVLNVKNIMGSLGNVEDVKQAINDAKVAIETNRNDISAYRSKWGSSFFFGKIFRMDLESRVTSKHLITALNSQLDSFSSQLETLPVARFSL